MDVFEVLKRVVRRDCNHQDQVNVLQCTFVLAAMVKSTTIIKHRCQSVHGEF